MVKILHISDLHFAVDGQSNNMQTVLLNMAESMAEIPVGQKLLIITGDFHNYKTGNYDQAEVFLRTLFDTMGIDPGQDVFVIPGNHDVGKPDMELPENKYWEHANASALNDIAKDVKTRYQENLDIRLKAFIPYCDFVRRIGVYGDSDDKLYPARVHVRCWRNCLNILHLNTALVADGNTKDNQKVDTEAATGRKIWEGFNTSLPALAIGHNNYFDLGEIQKLELAVPFLYRQVSAYLCGDTHRIGVDPYQQKIRLEPGYEQLLEIPNVICAKGISEENDSYSDFGFYWHDWDTETDLVTLRFLRWKPEYLGAPQPDGKEGHYPMRRKKESTGPTSHHEPSNDDNNEYDQLKKYLDRLLRDTRDAHPSFVLLRKDAIDKRLFPGVKEFEHDAEGKLSDDNAVSPVWEIIRRSWKSEENHSVVIKGAGGIGKTVSLFSVLKHKSKKIPPAIYIPMYKLVDQDGNCIDLSDYLSNLPKSNTKGSQIIKLAEKNWDNGPSLLLLLDGFNEVPGDKRRTILYMINDWNITHPGTQLIVVSRPMDGLNLDKELKRNPICITLKPLSRDTVQEYLGDKTPPEASPIWKVLTLPLFLVLYIKTNQLDDLTSDGYPLAIKRAETGGALIWNYLQRELLKEEREDWVLRCAIACEYIIPYVAYKMESKHQFTISMNQAKDLINKAINSLSPEKLPRHLAKIFEEYETRHLKSLVFSDIDWNITILKDVELFKRKNKSYSFIHQHFRDAFAGLYLVNQAEMMKDHELLPEVWQRTAAHDVMDYASELIELKDADRLWETNRQLQPTNSSSTYAMLELQRRWADGRDSQLDFSGMDLSNINFIRYMKNDGKHDADLKLFRKPSLSKGTKFSQDTFFNPGHSDLVGCVAVTEDGLCVSGSEDNTLRVWDLHSGECLHTLKGHSGSIECVAVTEDDLCVSGSEDKTLHVWNLHSGECLHTLNGHSGRINSVAATEDGLCVSGSGDGTLRVWDIHSGKYLHTLKGHSDSVYCVAVTEDGLCVSGSEDSTLRVWDIHSGECLHTLKGHSGPVRCVTATKDDLCVSGSEDNTLRVWDIHSGECLHTLNGHSDSVTCVAVTEDGLCVSGSEDSTLRVWDIHSNECLHTLEGHSHPVGCVTVTEDGLCVSGSWDKTLRVWDIHSGKYLHALEGHSDLVGCVTATEDGVCVSGSEDKTLRVWDIHSGECLHTLKGHSDSVYCVAVTEDGLCVSGSEDSTLRVWDIHSGKCLHTLKGHSGPVRCVTVTEDSLCISGSDDKTLRVWDIHSSECLHTVKKRSGSVECVASTEDGVCVNGTVYGTLRVWDIHSGKNLRTLKKHSDSVTCVAVTEDGLCVSGSWDNTLRVWNLYSGKCLHTLEGHSGWINCVAVTEDGLCVSGSWDSTLRVWNLHSGKYLHTLEGHADSVECVAVTEDGLCVSGSEDNTLRVWDIHSGKYLHALEGHSGSIKCVAVTEGGLCISASEDNTLRIWNIKTGQYLHVLHPMSIDVSGIDFSKAILDPELSKTLWQNGAKVPEEGKKNHVSK